MLQLAADALTLCLKDLERGYTAHMSIEPSDEYVVGKSTRSDGIQNRIKLRNRGLELELSLREYELGEKKRRQPLGPARHSTQLHNAGYKDCGLLDRVGIKQLPVNPRVGSGDRRVDGFCIDRRPKFGFRYGELELLGRLGYHHKERIAHRHSLMIPHHRDTALLMNRGRSCVY